MKYIRDRSGRFEQRPYYTEDELNRECERIVRDFLRKYRGEVKFPIETDALTLLVEQYAESVDRFADLSDEGEGVQGATYFRKDGKPQVRIARELSTQSWRENRLRTTITHELGHVRFHGHLWEVEEERLDLFENSPEASSKTCHRNSILNASQADWMEWQAAYVSGAILMPKRAVTSMVADELRKHGHQGRVQVDSDLGQKLIDETTDRFVVSEAAARVRLLQLGAVTEEEVGRSLFGESDGGA